MAQCRNDIAASPVPDGRPVAPNMRSGPVPFMAHAVALRFLGQVFLNGPVDGGLVHALREGLFAEWPVASVGTTSRQALEMLCGLAGPAAEAVYPGGDSARWDAVAQDLERDHAQLFVGPEIAVPPWESVWRDKDRLLFGESTFAVRAAYARFGLGADRPGNEPDDHLGREFGFLGHLAGLAASGAEAPESRAFMESPTTLESPTSKGFPTFMPDTLDAARAFLDDHLLMWVPMVREAMQRAARTPHYVALGLLAEGAARDLHADIHALRAAKAVAPAAITRPSGA